MNDLQSTFLILSASFYSTSCCFSSGITLKIVAFQLEASCLCCCVHSRKRKLAGPGRPPFVICHFPCFDHVLQCRPSGVHCLMYHDRDTFDFSQGHMTNNQPMAVPVQLSENPGTLQALVMKFPLTTLRCTFFVVALYRECRNIKKLSHW